MWWLPLLWIVADSVERRLIAVAPAESLQVTVVGTGSPVVLIPGLFGVSADRVGVVRRGRALGCRSEPRLVHPDPVT